MTPHGGRTRSWGRLLLRAALAVVLAAVGVGGWMIYRGVSASLQAEEGLPAARARNGKPQVCIWREVTVRHP